jgi:hypothetical protein
VTLRDQLLELGLELATRLSSQDRAVANARGATTEMSRARVERDAVEIFLAEHLADQPEAPAEESADERRSRASGS